MWSVFVVLLIFEANDCLADYIQTPSYFCKNQRPQNIVDISQLEGVWFVMEKVIHTDERRYTKWISSCPKVHISEDNSQFTTYSPLDKTYDNTYGSSYPYGGGTSRNPVRPTVRYGSEQDYYRERDQYDRRTTYSVDHPRWRSSHKDYIQHLYGMRYLRLYWDDYSETNEYRLRYNITAQGYWISSGPDGADPDHVVGNVQVIKAVGNHLVLTFCHRLNGKTELFSVILARETRLRDQDLYGVHELLNRRDLSTNAIQKMCSSSSRAMLDIKTVISALLLMLYICFN